MPIVFDVDASQNADPEDEVCERVAAAPPVVAAVAAAAVVRCGAVLGW